MLKTWKARLKRGERVVMHDGKRTMVACTVTRLAHGEVLIEFDVDETLKIVRRLINEGPNRAA